MLVERQSEMGIVSKREAEGEGEREKFRTCLGGGRKAARAGSMGEM